MVELARLPCPSALPAAFIPIRSATGPLTITTGPADQVVASTPWMLNSLVHAASSAARTTGRYSGRQPAIAALTATLATGRASAAVDAAPRSARPRRAGA